MFGRDKIHISDPLDLAIDQVHQHMGTMTPSSKEFADTTDQFVKLYNLKQATPARRISPDVLATVAGNIFVAVIVVGHEHAHVITSKAWDLVKKSSR